MAIEITERTVGIWFITLDRKTDYMAGLEAVAGGGFKLTYRFRYYGDVFDPWRPDNTDRKSWYTGLWTCDKESALGAIRTVIERLETVSGQKCTELLMENGDVDSFMRKFSEQDWAHPKMMQ